MARAACSRQGGKTVLKDGGLSNTGHLFTQAADFSAAGITRTRFSGPGYAAGTCSGQRSQIQDEGY